MRLSLMVSVIPKFAIAIIIVILLKKSCKPSLITSVFLLIFYLSFSSAKYPVDPWLSPKYLQEEKSLLHNLSAPNTLSLFYSDVLKISCQYRPFGHLHKPSSPDLTLTSAPPHPIWRHRLHGSPQTWLHWNQVCHRDPPGGRGSPEWQESM